ncbi:MAG: hypothetical protein SGI88_08820 [Candidatus Hydrogenedentes bacterium]|nr:hypothetical protein [Candidatus Hydrogenedentota bacterium]
MKRMRLLLAAGLVAACGFGASAIEPSHWGPYGNPEEPATRPYKAFWRGLKAFKYQVNATVRDGHRKAGAYGNVQFFRGVRRGLVEIGAGTYMGMAGQYPFPVEKTHTANEYIDADRRRAALADLPSTAALFWYGGLGSVGAVFGPGAVTIAQSEVDRYAMTPEERAEVAAAAAKTSLQNWEPDPHARNRQRPAGLKYSGPWKVLDEAPSPQVRRVTVETNPYSGDMIKKRRNGRIAD